MRVRSGLRRHASVALFLLAFGAAARAEPLDRDAVASRFAEALAISGIRLEWTDALAFDDDGTVQLTKVRLGLTSDRWVYGGVDAVYLRGIEKRGDRYHIARVSLPWLDARLDETSSMQIDSAEFRGVEFAEHFQKGSPNGGISVRSLSADRISYGLRGEYPLLLSDAHLAFGAPEGSMTPFEFGIGGMKLAFRNVEDPTARRFVEWLGLGDAAGYVSASGRADGAAGTLSVESAVVELVDRIFVEASLELAQANEALVGDYPSLLRPVIDFFFLNRALPDAFAKIGLRKANLWIDDSGFVDDFLGAGAELARSSRETMPRQLAVMALTQLALMTDPAAAATAAAALQTFLAESGSLTFSARADEPVPFGRVLKGGPQFVVEASAGDAAPMSPTVLPPASEDHTAPRSMPPLPRVPAMPSPAGSPAPPPAAAERG